MWTRNADLFAGVGVSLSGAAHPSRWTVRLARAYFPAMLGTSAMTGKPLAGLDHLRQSIRDILTTPIGSRVMRRDYGSRLFELIDAPTNRETIQEIYAATVEALILWEPRIFVQSVKVALLGVGRLELDMSAVYIPEGRIITLDGIAIA